jgi:hypothetical protein
MNQRRALTDRSPSEVAQILVELGRGDGPPKGARQRALRAATIGAGLTVTAKSAALSVPTAGLGGAAAPAPVAVAPVFTVASSAVVIAKWAAIGVVSALTLLAGTEPMRERAKWPSVGGHEATVAMRAPAESRPLPSMPSVERSEPAVRT